MTSTPQLEPGTPPGPTPSSGRPAPSELVFDPDDRAFNPEEWTVLGEDGRDLVLSFANFYHADPLRGDLYGRTFGNPLLEEVSRSVLSFSADRYLDSDRFAQLIALTARWVVLLNGLPETDAVVRSDQDGGRPRGVSTQTTS